MIKIVNTDYTTSIWGEEDYTDYTYKDKVFAIKNRGKCVALYNMDYVRLIEINHE